MGLVKEDAHLSNLPRVKRAKRRRASKMDRAHRPSVEARRTPERQDSVAAVDVVVCWSRVGIGKWSPPHLFQLYSDVENCRQVLFYVQHYDLGAQLLSFPTTQSLKS